MASSKFLDIKIHVNRTHTIESTKETYYSKFNVF